MTAHLTREALSAGASLVVMDKGRSSEAIFDQALRQADTLVDRGHVEHVARAGKKWRPGKAHWPSLPRGTELSTSAERKERTCRSMQSRLN